MPSLTLSPLEIQRVTSHNKQSQAKGLEGNLHVAEWEDILNHFGGRCPFTGTYDISMDHFVPESLYHAGTFVGNVFPLHPSLNASKQDQNPYLWIQKQSLAYQEVFEHVVTFLADSLNMTLDEFREWVFWCFAHPRTPKDVSKDHKRGYVSSLSLFHHHQRLEQKKSRVLLHFAKNSGLEEEILFVQFADWCLTNGVPIEPSSFSSYISQLFSSNERRITPC
ncbi:hypothetical protein ACFYKX_11395 [Cytobacillus sp. FJAT-54145]|uniref:HNH endonuclease n=1 Tax=Cytobacillus spartinae TaxID=3299023 RepID=A0ABW6KAF7_9BACI